jgi:4-amino-4-deoxy-L-arabinose transferase-like glycosyltransferase
MSTPSRRLALPETIRQVFARSWMPIALITAIGLALRLYRLDYQSVWYDESFSIIVARQPLWAIFEQLIKDFVQPPLHYLLLHGLLIFRDTGAFEARLLSAVFGAAAIPVLFLAGKTLFARTAGWIAAVMLAVSQLAVMYSQEVRPYALQQFLACCALLFCGLAIRTRSSKHWWAFIVTSTLAVYSHYYSVFFIMALFCWALFENPRVPFRRVLGGVAVIALMLTPWLASGVVDAALTSPKTSGVQPAWFSISWGTPLETVNRYNNGSVLNVLSSGPGLTFLLGAVLFSAPILVALGRVAGVDGWSRTREGKTWALAGGLLAGMGLVAGVRKPELVLAFLLLFRSAQVLRRSRTIGLKRFVTGDAAWFAVLVLAAAGVAYQGASGRLLFFLGLLIGQSLFTLAESGATRTASDKTAAAGRTGGTAYLALAWILPIGMPQVLAVFGLQYDVRYTLAGLPAYYLLAACGLSLIPASTWRGIAVAAGVAYALIALRANYFEPYKENWRDGLAVLAEGYRPGECVVFAPFGELPLEWQVYGYDRRHPAINVISPDRLGDEAPSCDRVWLLSYSRTSNTAASSSAIQQTLAATQHEIEHHAFHWVDVGVYRRAN